MYSPLTRLYQNGLCFCKLSSKWVSTAGAHSPLDGFEGSVHCWILNGPITESGWSCPRLEPMCRLVYFECKHYANSLRIWTVLWRKSVSTAHGFLPVLKSGHRHIAVPLSANRSTWKFGLVSNFPLDLMGYEDSGEAHLVWTHGLSNQMKLTESNMHHNRGLFLLDMPPV